MKNLVYIRLLVYISKEVKDKMLLHQRTNHAHQKQ